MITANDPLQGVIGYRERRIARLEILISHFATMLKEEYNKAHLQSWEHLTKEKEIQQCYLQHENVGAI